MYRYRYDNFTPDYWVLFEKDKPDPFIMHPDWLLRKVSSGGKLVKEAVED